MSSPHKIKICHLSTVHPPFDTRIFYKECISLSQEYEVHYVVPHTYDEIVQNVNIHAIAEPKSRLQRLLVTGPQLFRKALKIRAAVYHFHDPEIIPWALLLRKLTGAKIIYDVHELVHVDILEKNWLPLKHFFGGLYMRFERLALKHFHFVLAEISYSEYYKSRTEKLTLVYNFAQPQLIEQQQISPENNKLLLVGTLGGGRGLEITLEALYMLKTTGIIVELICVGKKDSRVDEIISKTKNFGSIKEQVHFTGYQPLTQAYKNAEGCFAGIALLQDLPNLRESYPTKLFEYMAAGLPVVCSDFPLYKQVIDVHRCGIYVSVNNALEVADAIGYLLRKNYQATQMGLNGRKAVETEFNWKFEEEKLLGLYKHILKNA